MVPKNYILYSTIAGLFSENLVIHYIYDLRLIYLLFAVNLLLLFFLFSLSISKGLLAFYAYLVLTGGWSIFAGTNTAPLFLSQFAGIAATSFYYFNFFRFEGFEAERLFHWYAKAALWVTWLALVLFVGRLIFQIEHIAVYSPLQEPARFTMVMFPAVFYSLCRSVYKKESYGTTAIFLVSFILAGSTTGFLGLFAGILLLNTRFKRALWIGVPLLALTATSLYWGVEKFRERIDNIFIATMKSDISEVTNLSAYVFFSNAYVSLEVASHRPFLGNGLGSHQLSHEKYLSETFLEHDLSRYSELNAKDANSMFFRILSEQGILGLFIVAVFIVRFFVRGNSKYGWMSKGMLIYFLLMLLREGHYFRPEFYFFVVLYYANHRAAQLNEEALQAAA